MEDKIMKVIRGTLRHEALNIIQVFTQLKKMNLSQEEIDMHLAPNIHQSAKRLVRHKTLQLSLEFTQLGNEYNQITRQVNEDERNKVPIDEQKYMQQMILELEYKMLEKALEIKKIENRKVPDTPIETNLIEHGLFGAGSHSKAVMKKKYSGGFVQQTRNGFRRLYYENANGVFLGIFDARVLAGLTKLYFENGGEQKFSFNFNELVRAMETEPSGKEYMELHESLINLSRTQIIMEEYYLPGSKYRQRTILYHPIDTLEFILRDGEEPGRERAASVTFHRHIHDSLQAGNFLHMNVVLFNDLHKPITKLLYVNMINSCAQNVTSYHVDTLTQHLNLQTENRSLVVSGILDAFQELQTMDVISSYEVVYGPRRSIQYINFVPGDLLQMSNKYPIEIDKHDNEVIQETLQLMLTKNEPMHST
ncbi:replication initiator protein A [Paenibacillus glucanolyticus]|jgi:hypothetical protein|uniref:Uncharacterized protein n=1 Tax=Paenibacillus glucanolyticus TaxID=59843 RepID=A0A163GIC0_9BACL|nr:replication initiator protein A [Paenibacillus glucanolyticus]KZS44988.1 hypothetical protein AWU65_03130 [Paenibacillus glucanolyticus]OMF63634.1 hypothetical protein BK142_32580 [Paenibacillus glucanolyticus]